MIGLVDDFGLGAIVCAIIILLIVVMHSPVDHAQVMCVVVVLINFLYLLCLSIIDICRPRFDLLKSATIIKLGFKVLVNCSILSIYSLLDVVILYLIKIVQVDLGWESS